MNFCAWTLCWNLYEIITAPHGAHQKTETDYWLVYWWIEFSDVNNDCTALLKVNTKAPVGVTLSHCCTSCKNHIFFFKNRNLQTSTSTPCTSLVSFKFFASLYLYLHCNDAYIPLSNGCRIFLFMGRRLLIEQLTRPAPVAPAEIDKGDLELLGFLLTETWLRNNFLDSFQFGAWHSQPGTKRGAGLFSD